MKIEEAYSVWNKRNEPIVIGSGGKRFSDCFVDKIIPYAEAIISDKDRQIEELKSEALEMSKLFIRYSVFHEGGGVYSCVDCGRNQTRKEGHADFCRVPIAKQIVEKYTKESEQTNE